jgi:hypothetical protein
MNKRTVMTISVLTKTINNRIPIHLCRWSLELPMRHSSSIFRSYPAQAQVDQEIELERNKCTGCLSLAISRSLTKSGGD